MIIQIAFSAFVLGLCAGLIYAYYNNKQYRKKLSTIYNKALKVALKSKANCFLCPECHELINVFPATSPLKNRIELHKDRDGNTCEGSLIEIK